MFCSNAGAFVSSAAVPRRILLLITDLEIGGTPTVVRELAIRLNDPPEVVVEVACLKGWGPVAEQLRDAGISVTAFGARRPWELWRVAGRLRALVRERSVDSVFSFLAHANAVAALAAPDLPGVKLFQSIQTVQPRPRWHWWLQRCVQRRADKVVVPSTAVARVARDRCGVPTERVLVIPNALDPAEFPRVDVFAGPRTNLGFLGRLDPVKRLPDFFQGLMACAARDANVQGHLFGDGPQRHLFEHMKALGGDGGHLTLHGAVSRPQDALRQMDVLFLPSTVEGFGLVLIEAMASGVPVIARPAGGVTDVVTHGVNGLLVGAHTFDPQELCDAVERLRADQAFRRQLIANGLATVCERFTWDAVLPQYRRLLGIDQS